MITEKSLSKKCVPQSIFINGEFILMNNSRNLKHEKNKFNS